MAKPPTAVAARIRAALAGREMSIADLAERLGYVGNDGRPTTYTYHLLNGSHRLGRGQLGRIAHLLELDPDDLYFDAGVMPPDMEAALTTDRALLRHVRILMNNASRNG